MNKELSILLEEIGKKAKSASTILNTATRDQKNKFFDFAISSIQENADAILAANHIDVKAAQENNKDEAFIDRLMLNNCLLYTSPSPRDATLTRMPSSA